MKKKILIVMMIFLFINGAVISANATNITFSNFSDTSSLTINGSAGVATTTDGVVLRLTEAAANQSGSAFSSATINAQTFSTYFEFRITDPGGGLFDGNTLSGADGIVFVVQSVSSDIGGAGQGMGYDGITPSIGIEFDTWHNSYNNDPSSNHAAIDINGEVNHGAGSPDTLSAGDDSIREDGFDNGDKWYVWIDYDGTTLEVRFNQNAQRPEDPLLSKDIDVAGILGVNEAYVGFTSGTGADWGNHDILYWEYHDTYDPIDNPDCYLQSDLDAKYEEGVEAGKAFCQENPEACGIVTSGDYNTGYQDGYEAGLSACGPPERITLVSPNGEVNNPITFTWNAVDNTRWYNLFIWDASHTTIYDQWYETDDSRADYPEVTCSSGTCSVTLSGDFMSGSYEFYVRSWNEYGYGDWSDDMDFTVTETSPF